MEPVKTPTNATKIDDVRGEVIKLRRDIKRWIIATILAIVGSDLLALLVIYKL